MMYLLLRNSLFVQLVVLVFSHHLPVQPAGSLLSADGPGLVKQLVPDAKAVDEPAL